MRRIFRDVRLLLSVVTALVFVAARPASAHFPWLILSEEERATLFFGENLADRTYHLPESIAKAEIRELSPTGESSKLTLEMVDTQQLVGLRAKQASSDAVLLVCDVTYGIYRGSRLHYTALHQPGRLPDQPNEKLGQAAGTKLFALATASADGVRVSVAWQGQPLVGSEVSLMDESGETRATATTDDKGQAIFSGEDVSPGLQAIMIGHRQQVEEQDVKSEAYYLTLTFAGMTGGSVSDTNFADLPFEITSFGAARVGDRAYVYGGHTGDAHSYSNEEQSNQLLSLDLADPQAEWQKLGEGMRLQGLAMVPHGSRLVLIGGFTAKNAWGEEHDLHSQATVRVFDTQSKEWTGLPALPAGRSSHDAAIIGDTIYVVGGWNMSGQKETVWHSSALSLDLSAEDPQWTELPSPPFQRRALATVAHQGQLYVIGGMDKKKGPTREVVVFDPQTKNWTRGPELPGKSPMAGFGAAGWSVGGHLVVSTYEGDVLRLNSDGSTWTSLGKSEDSRFFHRLLPLDEQHLLAVGGANMEEGKFLGLEVLSVN